MTTVQEHIQHLRHAEHQIRGKADSEIEHLAEQRRTLEVIQGTGIELFVEGDHIWTPRVQVVLEEQPHYHSEINQSPQYVRQRNFPPAGVWRAVFDFTLKLPVGEVVQWDQVVRCHSPTWLENDHYAIMKGIPRRTHGCHGHCDSDNLFVTILHPRAVDEIQRYFSDLNAPQHLVKKLGDLVTEVRTQYPAKEHFYQLSYG